jgi:hypothetical protein
LWSETERQPSSGQDFDHLVVLVNCGWLGSIPRPPLAFRMYQTSLGYRISFSQIGPRSSLSRRARVAMAWRMFSFDTLQHGNIQPSAIDDAYVGLRNAMLDDGLDQDPVAGDGIFTSHISRPKFDVEADTYTVRVVAIAGGHMIAHDVPGLRILDGPPEEENDEDNDSVVDLLKDAFVMQDAGNDIRNLPNPTIVREMNEPPVAGAELTVPQGRHDAMTPEGGYEAGGFVFTIEISEDFLT